MRRDAGSNVFNPVWSIHTPGRGTLPKHGYRHLSIREDVFKKLEDIRDKYGYGSLSDAIAYLLQVEEEHRDTYRQLTTITGLLNKIVELLTSRPIEADVDRRVEELDSEVSSFKIRLDMLSRRIKELEAKRRSHEG